MDPGLASGAGVVTSLRDSERRAKSERVHQDLKTQHLPGMRNEDRIAMSRAETIDCWVFGQADAVLLAVLMVYGAGR